MSASANDGDAVMTTKRAMDVINWTLPGLTLYYRDADLPIECVQKYTQGTILLERGFVDVSSKAGRPTKNTRFLIMSSKGFPLYETGINSETTAKWALTVIKCFSFFKVIDVYEKEGVTQISLLHIPYAGVPLFRNRVCFMVRGENMEEYLCRQTRSSLDTKLDAGDVVEALEEEEWIERTKMPLGMNETTYEFFPLEIPPFARQHTNDDANDLNNPFPTSEETTSSEADESAPSPLPK